MVCCLSTLDGRSSAYLQLPCGVHSGRVAHRLSAKASAHKPQQAPRLQALTQRTHTDPSCSFLQSRCLKHLLEIPSTEYPFSSPTKHTARRIVIAVHIELQLISISVSACIRTIATHTSSTHPPLARTLVLFSPSRLPRPRHERRRFQSVSSCRPLDSPPTGPSSCSLELSLQKRLSSKQINSLPARAPFTSQRARAFPFVMDYYASPSSFSVSTSNNPSALGSGSGTTKLSAYLGRAPGRPTFVLRS